jgi:hypothetical protein
MGDKMNILETKLSSLIWKRDNAKDEVEYYQDKINKLKYKDVEVIDIKKSENHEDIKFEQENHVFYNGE